MFIVLNFLEKFNLINFVADFNKYDVNKMTLKNKKNTRF